MPAVHAPKQDDLRHDTVGGHARTAGGPKELSPQGLYQRLIFGRLAALRTGTLVLKDQGRERRFGEPVGGTLPAELLVRNRRFYRSTVMGGALGAAESYLRGEWDSPDLTNTLRVLARNADALRGIERGPARLLRPARTAIRWLRKNTRAGSKKNISAHYDLSNDFFALMLDPTMTYSSGVFPSEASTLEEASLEKYERVCRKLALTPGDRVIEIGTGWGGFAEFAASCYGCHVTTTTISAEQHAYARRRLAAAGLSDRVTLLRSDYRDLHGQYDKLVSIEMIEAVGESFLPAFFRRCSELLRPDGMMVLQAITIPAHRYADYRRSIDFIQRHVFPGGFLPSPGAITACLGKETDFRLLHTEDFGDHYARTLAAWRERFWRNIAQVQSLGFDEQFVRTWHYYLCYCEAAFEERLTGVSQMVLTKPCCRRPAILA